MFYKRRGNGNWMIATLIMGHSLVAMKLWGQLTFPVNGIREPKVQKIYLTGANIYTESGWINNATMVIQNGRIKEIAANIDLPLNAYKINYRGKYIYPAFVEIYCNFGMPEKKASKEKNNTVSSKQGAYLWNEALRPETKAYHLFSYNTEAAVKWREAGFVTVNTHLEDGISRGTSCVVLLSDENEHETLIRQEAFHMMSFSKGHSSQEYPSSLMGAIALIRQAYYDGYSYEQAIKPVESNISIEEWNRIQSLPVIFAAADKWDIFRIFEIGREFNKEYVIKTAGDEYQRIDDLRHRKGRYIIPVTFPALIQIEDPLDAIQVPLADMKHWEMAPSNAYMLYKSKLPFVFTSHGLDDRKAFLDGVRKCVERGLPEDHAIQAMTLIPAQWLQVDELTGSIRQGKYANFIITDGPVFDSKTKIMETWCKGKRQIMHRDPPTWTNGIYSLRFGDYEKQMEMKLEGVNLISKSTDSDSMVGKWSWKLEEKFISATYFDESGNCILLNGTRRGENWKGRVQLDDGSSQAFELVLKQAEIKKIPEAENTPALKTDTTTAMEPLYPFVGYGNKTKPLPANYLIKGATLWTCEEEGILDQSDLLIRNGKIVQIGKAIQAPDAVIIDGKGKHVTPGLIDEHSHIAISRGVNECTQASTAEVRIGDVINPEDINIYRQVAGGVTAVQLLHGSCNPVGGQSAIIKLKWGYLPEEMKIPGADGFIKFALGENVKRSWSSDNQRFPDTRMGVEQVYEDIFTRAREYLAARKKNPTAVRRDLELDAIAEILTKKRFITCHSYTQAEINMLMKLAERHEFTVNTFTHILEGYKVADIMKKHGAGAAGFSDWWAYKFEVYEAIPYNGKILHDQGVITAFNSDDAEMGRRLNQEAAKAVMYGGVPEQEALKFVTLNPAKLLHLDHRTGSLKAGKDADVVVWDGHPLSIYAKVERTFIDGILFYDRERDADKQKFIVAERARLIEKMVRHKGMGEDAKPYKSKPKKMYHCDTVEEDYMEVD